jgi:hypothetical protein
MQASSGFISSFLKAAICAGNDRLKIDVAQIFYVWSGS